MLFKRRLQDAVMMMMTPMAVMVSMMMELYCEAPFDLPHLAQSRHFTDADAKLPYPKRQRKVEYFKGYRRFLFSKV